MQIDFFRKRAATFRGSSRTVSLAVALGWLLAAGMGLGPALAHAVEPAFLHASGRDIVNAEGQPVLLRGLGLGNWMLPEGYMWKFGGQGDRPRRIEKLVSNLIGPEPAARFWTAYRRNYITEADIQRIAALGYNSVRPALNSRLFLTESDPPAPVQEGYALLDNLVRWCKANGVYVIIDMHAAPGGQTGQNIDDSANDEPELFQQPKYQDRLVALWTALARRYKDEPAVAGYDLLNEPLPARTGAEAKFKQQLEPLYQRITRAIRAVDKQHIIILEGADWANDWSVFSRPFDSNVVYQFHYYCWDSPVQLKSIQTYLDFGRRFNVPIWVGETGESSPAIYWATTEYFEANQIGWSFWPWKKMDAGNAPCSIKAPANWEAVAAYSRGGPKPGRQVAQNALDQLLVNLRLTNCVSFPGVVNAMLRRAPVRIEAENYGQQGLNVSYFVTDTNAHSQFYRPAEPVKITATDSGRQRSRQFITLNANEWTAYTVASEQRASYEVTLHLRAQAAPAEAELIVNGNALNVKIPSAAWVEIPAGTISLNRGANHLKWLVQQGEVDLDWIEVTTGTDTGSAFSANQPDASSGG
jgi:hypothetical protein